MSPEEREELASLYVLGLLEGSELAAFERGLAADPELAALVGELENASTLLATSVPQHRAPDALRDSVLNQIKEDDRTLVQLPVQQAAEPARRPTFSFGWVPWAIAAGLTVACALLWNERSRLSEAIGGLEQENQSLSVRIAGLDEERARLETRIAGLDQERARLETRISTLENEKNQLQVRVASLESRDPLRDIRPIMLTAQPGAPKGAEVVALWDPHRQEGALHVARLPDAAPDKDYQLWIISPESKQPMDAGLIPGSAECITFSAAQPVTQVAAFAISLEPKGGSPAPRGPVIYLGKF
jgi:anti-sigma-K factor RskA